MKRTRDRRQAYSTAVTTKGIQQAKLPRRTGVRRSVAAWRLAGRRSQGGSRVIQTRKIYTNVGVSHGSGTADQEVRPPGRDNPNSTTLLFTWCAFLPRATTPRVCGGSERPSARPGAGRIFRAAAPRSWFAWKERPSRRCCEVLFAVLSHGRGNALAIL